MRTHERKLRVSIVHEEMVNMPFVIECVIQISTRHMKEDFPKNCNPTEKIDVRYLIHVIIKNIDF